MNRLLLCRIIGLAIALVGFVFFPNPVQANILASQVDKFDSILYVNNLIQELGNNLSGKAATLTFRVRAPASQQFEYTALNTRIYDKDNNNSYLVACVPPSNSYTAGLLFNTEGVPKGYEDVSVDFSCRNYNFIPGHRYLAKIANANYGSYISFAAAAYTNTNLDYFPGGGLRYGSGNRWDYLNGSGYCDPERYVWGVTYSYYNGCYVWTTPKDDLYFIVSDSPYQPPTQAAFLDLPWDYESKGLTFNEAALLMTSYFDHEYPLLSSGLSEGADSNDTIINFRGVPRKNLPYSSHDGYDYAKLAKVNIGDPVLAAAAGTATYINSCGACGNMVVIDHGNGYQTRYLHLQKDGLITNNPGQKVPVSARQPIGKVGATGNVSPAGDAGAHIHFGVFQDKNKDGNFDDNVPDGVTDPFGWQSKDPDPWENYSFYINGAQRTGNKSFYLWTKKLDNLDAALTSNGGVFQNGRYSVNFPQGATSQNLNLSMRSSPNIKIDSSLISVGSTLYMQAKDAFGNLVTQYPKFFTILVNFGIIDLSNFKTDTLSFYSSSDGIHWTKEPTTVDLGSKTASTNVNHLTYFSLAGERADITPPKTEAVFAGEKGRDSWYRSDVQITLNAKDNEGGLGVDYTMYKKDGADWEMYKDPVVFTEEGHHKIEFYSADKDENLENIKFAEFDIDKTPPNVTVSPDRTADHDNWYSHPLTITVAGTDANLDSCDSPITYSSPDNINASVTGTCTDKAGNIGSATFNFQYDSTPPQITLNATPSTIWPPDNKMVDVTVSGKVLETYPKPTNFTVEDEYRLIEPKLTDFGQTVQLEAKRDGGDLDGRVYIIKAVSEDLAGNKNEAQTQVLVPHDQGRKN